MKKETYDLLEGYMLSCCADSAHDAEHIYRVLYNALEIAGDGQNVDLDILIAACLLHDIGRKAQLEDPTKCHAQVGSQMAHAFLLANGFSRDFADRVAHCIQVHRFRKRQPPQTEEARILFDADKLDVTGCLGIARTLMYKGNLTEPLYAKLSDGRICDGSSDAPSFFREYKFKLEKLYDQFCTARGAALAKERQAAAVAFYENLYREVNCGYVAGTQRLQKILEK